ncbi:CDAN1-interacting nuclease 1 [Tachysurus ichikawai]
MKLSRAEYRVIAKFTEQLRPTRQCMKMLKDRFPELPVALEKVILHQDDTDQLFAEDKPQSHKHLPFAEMDGRRSISCDERVSVPQ